jgi:hypothetical protein
MGLFRRRSTSEPLTITAEELYEAIHGALVSKVPSLAPTITPFGLMLLYLPDTALILNLSDKHWAIAMYDASAAPDLTLLSTIDTGIAPLDTADLIVSVLERCHETYSKAVNDPAVSGKEDAREWFAIRRDEVGRALTPG